MVNRPRASHPNGPDDWLGVFMGKLIDPTLCPECRSILSGDARCPACGLQLQGPAAVELWQTMQRADQLIDQLRLQAAAAPVPAATPARPTPTGTAPPPPMRRPVKKPSASVPVILLTLGGLCVMVAAIVFVAVAWGSLGVGGRTAILGLVTLLMTICAVVLTHKELRWGAETFWVIVTGMVIIDILGARAAGLFGDDFHLSRKLSVALLLVLMSGLAYAVGIWSAKKPAGQIISVQITALIGLCIGNVSGIRAFETPGLMSAIVIPVFAILAIIAWRPVKIFGFGLSGLVIANWFWLVGVGILEALDTQAHWWASLDWWPLALAGGYAAVATVPKLPYAARVAAAGMCLSAWSLLILGPDHSTPTQRTTWIALMILASAILVALGGRVWSRAGSISGTLWAIPAVLSLALEAFSASIIDNQGSDQSLTKVVFGGLEEAWWAQLLLGISVSALLLSAHRLLPEHTRRNGLIASIPLTYLTMSTALIGVAGALGLPLWAFTGILTVLLVGAILTTWSCGPELTGLLPGGATTAALTILWLSATFDNDALAAILSSMLVVIMAGYWGAATRAGRRAETLIALAAIPILAMWILIRTWFAVDLNTDFLSVSCAILAAVVLLAAKPVSRLSGQNPERLVLESIGILFGIGASLFLWSEHHGLTITIFAGTLALVSLIHQDREPFAWASVVGGLFGWWSQVANDTFVPERYSLPLAAMLLAAGIWRLRRSPDQGSLRALAPGLILGLLPSLILALDDPLTWRGAILFAAGVLILLIGAFTRTASPFYAGAVITALMALRYLGPWAQGIPRWVGIGIVGLLLLGLGVSWEFGRKNLKTTSDYLRSLR